MTGLAFRSSDDVLPLARRILAREQRRIEPLAPDAELVLTGASSVPGLLTVGDIDLHLRVRDDRFATTVVALVGPYRPVLAEIWCSTLATFEGWGRTPFGIAVTPIGSVHDNRFRSAWRRLRADPSAVAAYNALKRRHAGGDEGSYLTEKAAFFDVLISDL